MKKEDMIKSLLRLHCIGCSGETFGCRGCSHEENIRTIVMHGSKENKKE